MIACYVVANEADVIADSLRSVKAYVERFVIVDSVFRSNPIDATHSTDNTREMCEAICAPVPLTYIESPRKLGQEEARNRYLDEVEFGDWVINLDGDEVLYADYQEAGEVFGWLEHGESPDALNVPILTSAVMHQGSALDMPSETYRLAPVIHTRGHAPRIFRRTRGLRYREVTHANGLVDNQGVYVGNETLSSLAVRDDRLLIVNHHVRQSFAAYQADAVWEIANDRPLVAA